MAGGIAQDDARENRLIDLFNLSRPADRVRHGTDAVLRMKGVTYEFELKSATTAKGGISTVRDLGPDHIKKWKNKHWIMAFFSSGSLQYCQYGSPDDMETWITEKWNYIKADFEMAKHVPSLSHPLIFKNNHREKCLFQTASPNRLGRLRNRHPIVIEAGLLAKCKAQVAK